MIAKVKKNPTDPIAIIIGGVIEILAILGVPEQLGLDATQVAQLGGAVLMIAGSIRFMLTKHEADAPPVAQDSSQDEQETPDATAADDTSSEEDSNAAPQEKPEEPSKDSDAPIVGPPPSTN